MVVVYVSNVGAPATYLLLRRVCTNALRPLVDYKSKRGDNRLSQALALPNADKPVVIYLLRERL